MTPLLCRNDFWCGLRAQLSVALVLLLGVLAALSGATRAWAQTPYGVPVEPPTLPTQTGMQSTTSVITVQRGSAGGESVRFVPVITVAERYDSNILFLPNKVHDFVTNISPGTLMEYRGEWVEGTFLGGLTSELYVRNPGLNYVGTNESLYLNFDNLAGRLIRGWTFRLTDAFVYTPQMPAFAAPQEGNQFATEFVRGMQAYRNNALSNSVTAQTGYAVSSRISVNGTYSYSFLRFLNDSTAQGSVGLLNTTAQSLTLGPQYQLSPTDTVGVSYQYQNIAFSSGAQGSGPVTAPSLASANIHGASASWQSNFMPGVILNLSPGVSEVEGIGGPQWTARALLQWNIQSMLMSLHFTRGLYPSFFIDSGVLVSEMVGVSVLYNVTDKWSINGDGNYSNSRLIGNTSSQGALSFSGKGFGVRATYRLSSTMFVTGSFTHSDFEFGPALVVARDVVSLQFRKEWR